MSNDRLNGHREALRSYRLSVLRIKAGEEKILRMLSDQWSGLFTHYVKRRSEYCPGRVCQCQHSRLPRVWKGYLAAELYQQKENLWFPQVLEVTEYLELDFRSVYARGQVWKISRRAEKPRETNPVTGTLLETRPATTFPPPHRIYDSLIHLYHVPVVELIHPNPLPDRTFVKPSEGAAPKCFQDNAPPSAEEQAKNQEKLRELLDLRKQLSDGMKP